MDATFFKPDAEGYDEDSLSFIGRMDYYPNQECMLEFCAKTFPLVRAKRPQAKLLIVGADPSPEIRRLGELPGVTVTGSVPDVRPYILRSAAMVAPLNIARGTQNKILEAMAMGVPVVTSPMGRAASMRSMRSISSLEGPRRVRSSCASYHGEPGRARAPRASGQRTHADEP